MLRRLRAGEATALVGVALIIASLLAPAYHSPAGELSAWETFGAGVALEIAAAFAGLAMVVAALTERDSSALSVATTVWCVPIGLLATIGAVVRAVERPDLASGPAIGVWLALGGCCAILIGAWISMRDERPSLYSPPRTSPRPRP